MGRSHQDSSGRHEGRIVRGERIRLAVTVGPVAQFPAPLRLPVELVLIIFSVVYVLEPLMYVVSSMPESSVAVTVTLAWTTSVVPTTTGLPPLTTTLSIVLSPAPPSAAWAVVAPVAVATSATQVLSRARGACVRGRRAA
ncbi:hypothetical protein [Streptomyces sp. NPDC052012]|uniref:hypothetical protein n=1 Tax=Streptomyces sp. NPDC052012 TaxID=3155051 RepID=UPI00344EA02D